MTSPDVLIVTSQGGHLAQMLALKGWWDHKSRVWVAPPTADVVDRLRGERVVYSHFPTTRHVTNALRNFVLAWFSHEARRSVSRIRSSASMSSTNVVWVMSAASSALTPLRRATE